jgi:hypothetical protein
MLARKTRRGGYAMMIVVLFLVLFMALLGMTFRDVATVLRVEAARSLQILRDEGSLAAAAQGVAMLQNGPPPSDPFTVTVGVTTSAGMQAYQISISSNPSAANQWVVQAVPAP